MFITLNPDLKMRLNISLSLIKVIFNINRMSKKWNKVIKSKWKSFILVDMP